MTAVLPRPPHLEGPVAAARTRPHLSHVSLEGPHPPLRAALARGLSLEGPPHKLIQQQGINPALIHHHRKRK